MADWNRKVLLKLFRNASKNVYKFLVGNKTDLEERRQVTYEQAKEFADTYGMKYIETSAKTAHNVAEAFLTMTKEIISKNSNGESEAKKGGII